MSKVRELYEAMRREREGKGEDLNETVTCDSALREAGVDATLIARKLKEQLGAKQPRWNPQKKAFDLFADNDARLAALREAIKILGGYPTERGDNQAPLIIDFTDSGLSPVRRYRQTDPNVAETVPEALGNQTTSPPKPPWRGQ